MKQSQTLSTRNKLSLFMPLGFVLTGGGGSDAYRQEGKMPLLEPEELVFNISPLFRLNISLIGCKY